MRNIVVIVADQLSFRGLQSYGGTAAFPAIDSIFQSGTTIDRAYTPCPLCMPARAAFWSGRYPHRTGVLSNGRAFPRGEVPESTPTLGSLFRTAGWETVHFGKEHDAGALHGFRRVPVEPIEMKQPLGYPINADTFRDRRTVEQFVSYMGDRRSTERLLAVVDLNNPHNICGWVGEMARRVSGEQPFVPPQRDPAAPGFPPDRTDVELPPLPPNFNDTDLGTRPRSVQYVCCAHNRLAQTQEWDDVHYRLYLDAYRYYTGLANTEISRVMDAVRAALPEDDTLVVFFSDHGDSMAAHRGVTKHTTLYEETTRVPLAFAGPGVAAGARVDGPVSLLDLTPTLADFAGIDDPALNDMDGISIAPALRGEDSGTAARFVASEWHTEWGFTIEPGRMLTNGRYKYMTYAEDGGEELYDLAVDPYETRNLAPDEPPALQEMRAAFETHLRGTNDEFHSLDAVVDPRWRTHAPGPWNHTGIAAPQAE